MQRRRASGRQRLGRQARGAEDGALERIPEPARHPIDAAGPTLAVWPKKIADDSQSLNDSVLFRHSQSNAS
jgi:hypothetical protein